MALGEVRELAFLAICNDWVDYRYRLADTKLYACRYFTGLQNGPHRWAQRALASPRALIGPARRVQNAQACRGSPRPFLAH